MTTEQEFKARVRFNSRKRFIGKLEAGMTLIGHYDALGRPAEKQIQLDEEWHIEKPTQASVGDAEDKLRELLWRRWNQMGRTS